MTKFVKHNLSTLFFSGRGLLPLPTEAFFFTLGTVNKSLPAVNLAPSSYPVGYYSPPTAYCLPVTP